MRFTCFDITTKHLIYRYSDKNEDDYCEECLNVYPIEIYSKQCKQNRYYHIKRIEESNSLFVFCFKNISTQKKANSLAKMVIHNYLEAKPVLIKTQKLVADTTDIIVHNTRNLNAQINAKLLNILNQNDLLKANDKIAYIEDIIKQRPFDIAREILSIIKSISQINSQYTIIDYIDGRNQLLNSDFSCHPLHKLLVLSFYLYEQDFLSNRIKVKIGQTKETVRCNYNTIITAFAQIFDNAIKYASPNSEINIIYNTKDKKYVDIIIQMDSLFISDKDIQKIYENGERGEFVDKCDSKGSGLGMGIIKKMVELNHGYYSFRRVSNKPYYINDIPFSNNEFIVKLPRCH